MYHTIEFAVECLLDIEISPKHRLEQLRASKGSRLKVRVQCYVMETDDGPVEVCDLIFDDGSVTRQVRCGCFSFVD